jgi:hypothetical protein
MASVVGSPPKVQQPPVAARHPVRRGAWLALAAGGVVVTVLLARRFDVARAREIVEGIAAGGPDVHSIDLLPAAARLLAAASIGLIVTLAQRHVGGTHLLSRSVAALEQAQVLLALAGALMMMVIGNSLAHAFGIAGAASIIRFRTPVEDPRDVTVLFLAMALGMAAGLGAFAIAAVGTVFLCTLLVLLHALDLSSGRSVKVRLVSATAAFPLTHVHAVFDANDIVIEPLESSAGTEAAMRFRGRLPAGAEPIDALLQRLSEALLAGGAAGIKEVSWEPGKVH